jgi:transposase InsO family protein
MPVLAGASPLNEPHRLGLDNAVAERWFASLKVALIDRALPHPRRIFRWIAWYNRFRLHSANGYLPPID